MEYVRPPDFGKRSINNLPRASKLIRERKLAELEQLLLAVPSKKTDCDNCQFTPLHDACIEDNLEAVQLLVNAGADIESKTDSLMTPLYLASLYGHARIVDFLLEKGASVSVQTKYSLTPLHAASYKGSLKIVEALVGKGADVDASIKSGKTPILLAMKENHLLVVRFLLENGCNLEKINAYNRHPLLFCCILGNLEMFNLIFEYLDKPMNAINKASPSLGWTPLVEAIQMNRIAIVKRLIELGASTTKIGSKGNQAVHYACYERNFECFKLVLDNTPESALKYSKRANSLVCVLIDADWLEGLQYLAERASSDVMSCPSTTDETGVYPPLSFLMKMKSRSPERKQMFIETILSSRAQVDPDFNHLGKLPTIRLIEAIVRMHQQCNDKDDECFCEKTLYKFLELGVDPDVCLKTAVPTAFMEAIPLGFTRGLAALFRYTNIMEPEVVLCYAIFKIYDDYRFSRKVQTSMIHHRAYRLYGMQATGLFEDDEFPIHESWLEREMSVVRLLAYACTDMSRPQDYLELRSHECKNGDLDELCDIVRARDVVPLKKLCRSIIRTHLHEVNRETPKNFRPSILQLPMPKRMIEYILYYDL